MRILITGGAGCLGSNLIEYWIPKGYELLIIDNFVTGRKEVVPNISGLNLIEGSITDEALVRRCFHDFKPDVVVHSAASYKDPNNWIEDTQTNVIGTINVVNAAKFFAVKRFVNFQTALCYGRPSRIPISLEEPNAPFTSYGISKTAGESYLSMADLPFVSLRLSNITGPRLAIGPIPTFYTRLKEGKSCFCSDTKRDFMDISDFFALMDLVIVENAPTGIFNVSTGHGNTIKDIFDLVVEHLGVEIREPVTILPPGDDDIHAVVLDPSSTEQTFGWKAEVNFKDTIFNMLKWYDVHGVSAIFSHLADPTKRSDE